jgi:hypothetical protein
MVKKLDSKNNYLMGVISDTHGHIPSGVPNAFKDVDLIIHAGDIGEETVLDKNGPANCRKQKPLKLARWFYMCFTLQTGWMQIRVRPASKPLSAVTRTFRMYMKRTGLRLLIREVHHIRNSAIGLLLP